MAPSTAAPVPVEKCNAEQPTSYCLRGGSLWQVPNMACAANVTDVFDQLPFPFTQNV